MTEEEKVILNRYYNYRDELVTSMFILIPIFIGISFLIKRYMINSYKKVKKSLDK
jgi:hypothetical protein